MSGAETSAAAALTPPSSGGPGAASGPSGIRDLGQLLCHLAPALSAELYCFTFDPAPAAELEAAALMVMREEEGTTLILPLALANAAHLEAGFLCQKITLKVPSSLEAVGMMAAIAKALQQHGLPCNAVAGYHHDHLFVPTSQAEAALACLQDLQARWAPDQQ